MVLNYNTIINYLAETSNNDFPTSYNTIKYDFTKSCVLATNAKCNLTDFYHGQEHEIPSKNAAYHGLNAT